MVFKGTRGMTPVVPYETVYNPHITIFSKFSDFEKLFYQYLLESRENTKILCVHLSDG